MLGDRLFVVYASTMTFFHHVDNIDSRTVMTQQNRWANAGHAVLSLGRHLASGWRRRA